MRFVCHILTFSTLLRCFSTLSSTFLLLIRIKYSIARWAVYDGTIEITEHGLKGVSEHNVIHQYFEDAFYDAMLGKVVTLSILSENGDFACNTGIIQDRAINTWSVASVELPSGTVASVYKWNGIRAGLLMVQITIAQGDVISKVKLEPGPISTLLNDPPPNQALEMLKCKMYQNVIGSNVRYTNLGFYQCREAGSILLLMDLPTKMRIVPTIVPFVATIVKNGPNGQNYIIKNPVTITNVALDGNNIILVIDCPEANPGDYGWVQLDPNIFVVLDANL